MSSNEHLEIIFFLLLLFFLGIPKLASAGIEFLSTPSAVSSDNGGTGVFENTRFQFSSDGKPVSFHFSGSALEDWGTNQMDSSNAILDYAYLRLKSRALRTAFSLGRIQLDDGALGESMDGIYSRTNLSSRARVSFFLGRTVGSEDDLLGGKFAYKFNDHAAAGISYVTESAGPQSRREEAAVDLRLRPFNKLTLSGRSLIDLRTGKWTEHSYSASIGPFRKAAFLFDAFLTDYGDSGSSVLFPAVGAGVQYSLSRSLTAGINVRRTEDPFARIVFSQGVRLSYSSSRNWSAGVSAVRTYGDDLDVLEMNLTAMKKVGNLEASLNLQKIVHNGKFSSDKNSAAASLGLVYELSRSYRLAADVQETKTPDSEADFRGFLRLEYRFGS